MDENGGEGVCQHDRDERRCWECAAVKKDLWRMQSELASDEATTAGDDSSAEDLT